MADVNWPPILASLAGGGAIGAIITLLANSYRARKQPVGVRKEILPVFRPVNSAAHIGAKIMVPMDAETNHYYTFNNLFLAEITIVNNGNRDNDEFNFGATLGTTDRCIFVEATSENRHHEGMCITPVSPSKPTSELDFSLKPFNRKDQYSFKLYIVINDDQEGPKEISISSSSAVKFVEIPRIGEIIAGVASSAVLKFGPFSIGLQR